MAGSRLASWRAPRCSARQQLGVRGPAHRRGLRDVELPRHRAARIVRQQATAAEALDETARGRVLLARNEVHPQLGDTVGAQLLDELVENLVLDEASHHPAAHEEGVEL